MPYILPQEHGNHFDTRWLALTDDTGRGLRVEARDPRADLFEFSASHYTAEALTRAAHTHELKRSASIILNLDRGQRGLGTAACGPDVLPAYRLKAGTHLMRLRLRGITSGTVR